MQKSQIEIGKEYALRESRAPNTPLQRAKILQHIRGKKWKAEWIDPNPVLIEFVESQNLLVRWKDHKALLRDEERERQLQQDNEHQGYKASSPLDNVLSQVFDATGEQGLYFDGGVLQGPPESWTVSENTLALIQRSHLFRTSIGTEPYISHMPKPLHLARHSALQNQVQCSLKSKRQNVSGPRKPRGQAANTS